MNHWRRITPVSYTHLDVYKRQDEDRTTVLYLQDCAQQAGQETRFLYVEELGLGVGGMLTDLDDNVIPVSYTHLDVYKRQS